jgi:hypothetical protein
MDWMIEPIEDGDILRDVCAVNVCWARDCPDNSGSCSVEQLIGILEERRRKAVQEL